MENSPAKGYLCVVVAAVLWASSGTAGKTLFGHGITPFDVVQVNRKSCGDVLPYCKGFSFDT